MSLIKTLSMASLAAATSFSLIACGGDDGGGDDGPDTIDPAGTHSQYVVSGLTVPTSGGVASDVALDLDGDDLPDNALGALLGSLSSQAGEAFDLQAGVDEELNAGTFILLASIKATDLVNANGVGTYVYFGANASPAPCATEGDPTTCGQHLQGGASFSISADSPQDATLAGTLAGGELVSGPGSVAIEVPIGDGNSIGLNLIGARMEVTVGENGLMSGRLGGAVSIEDVENDILPTIHSYVVDIIDGDCTGEGENCGCGDSSTGAQVLGFLDTNMDCSVPLDELKENSLIKATLLEPDLDLLDADGNFDPGADDEVDSLSIAVGFQAVPAEFDLPAGVE